MLIGLIGLASTGFNAVGGFDLVSRLNPFDGSDGGGCPPPHISLSDVATLRADSGKWRAVEQFVMRTWSDPARQRRILTDTAFMVRVARGGDDACDPQEAAFKAFLFDLLGGGNATINTTLPIQPAVQPSGADALGDSLGRTADNLRTVLTNTITGAAAGAEASSRTAASTSGLTLSNPFVLAAIGFGVFLLLKR